MILSGSCGSDENIVVFTDSEVIRLLSNDSTKTWERKIVLIDGQSAGYSECDLFTNIKYYSGNDSLIYSIGSQPDFCGGMKELLDSGYWEVLEESNQSNRIDRIAYYSINGDTTVKKIMEITAIFLTTENDIDNEVVRETYESRLPY
jgi:hypothetical protein